MDTQGSRAKEIRLKLNLSQEEMGRIFNVTKSYVSLVERDKCRYSHECQIKLLLDYNVNLNYLLAGIGSPFLQPAYSNIQAKILSEIKKILDENGIK